MRVGGRSRPAARKQAADLGADLRALHDLMSSVGEIYFCGAEPLHLFGGTLEHGWQGVVERRWDVDAQQVRAYEDGRSRYEAFSRWAEMRDRVGGDAGFWSGPPPTMPRAPPSHMVVRFPGIDRDFGGGDLLPFVSDLSRGRP